jgi:hypothetical protein
VKLIFTIQSVKVITGTMTVIVKTHWLLQCIVALAAFRQDHVVSSYSILSNPHRLQGRHVHPFLLCPHYHRSSVSSSITIGVSLRESKSNEMDGSLESIKTELLQYLEKRKAEGADELAKEYVPYDRNDVNVFREISATYTAQRR